MGRARVAGVALIAATTIVVPATGATHSGAQPGTYRGTSSSGNAVSITVGKSGRSGLFRYCGQREFNARFTITADRKFTASTGTIGIRGKFRGSKASGTIDRATGCDGHPATFTATLRK